MDSPFKNTQCALTSIYYIQIKATVIIINTIG